MNAAEPNSKAVLVAGASGALGRYVVRELVGRGHRVRALARRPQAASLLNLPTDAVVRADALDAESLEGCCDGIDVVFSCMGASVSPSPAAGRDSYSAVDYGTNANLLTVARRSGVRRFVYVSFFGAEKIPDLDYTQGHERFVNALRASSLSHGVVRPTGFFSVLEELLVMARRGTGVIVGDGTARSNPIDDRDLAVVCADAVESSQEDFEVGGPKVYTRREMVEKAFETLDKPPRIRSIPASVVRLAGLATRPFNPRLSHLFAFTAAVTQSDFVAPPFGSRTLEYFLRERTGRGTHDGRTKPINELPLETSPNPGIE